MWVAMSELSMSNVAVVDCCLVLGKHCCAGCTFCVLTAALLLLLLLCVVSCVSAAAGWFHSDMEKLRLKPRNFKFAPVKGWLGGDQSEKVEGWKCTVYEAAGKVRVNSSLGPQTPTPTSLLFNKQQLLLLSQLTDVVSMH